MKQFFGFNSYEEAEKVFGSKYLDNPKWKSIIRKHKVVVNSKTWPQETTQKETKQITTDHYIIEFSI